MHVVGNYPECQLSVLHSNKSDTIDSRALATLHLLNMLEPSYVPDQEIRRLRRLTRFRAKMVDMKIEYVSLTQQSFLNAKNLY